MKENNILASIIHNQLFSEDTIKFIKKCYIHLNQARHGVWAFADLSEIVWHQKVHKKNKELYFSIVHDAIAYEIITYEEILQMVELKTNFLNFYSSFVSKINTSHEYTNFLEDRINTLENRFGLVWKEQEEQLLKIVSEKEIVLGVGRFLINEEYEFISESKDKKKKIIKDKQGKDFTLTRKRGDSFIYFCKDLDQLFLLYSVQSKVNIYSFVENHYTKYYPILVKKGEKFGFGEVRDNLLIEGDNYYALQLLQFTHKGKIDVIYIDPPYNTGNGDFKYNDSYVSPDDTSRHSKWLSFMDKRLRLAKELLSDQGIIFISIDENEHAHLKILADNIFGEKNIIGDIIWINSAGGNTDDNFILNHEHILVYKKKNGILLGDFKDLSDYKNPDNDPNGEWKNSDPTKPDYIEQYDYPIQNPFTGQIDYCTKTRSWVFPKETFEELKKEIGKQHERSFGLFWHQDIKKKRRGFFIKRYKNQLRNIERQSFSSIIDTYNNEDGKDKKLLTGIGKKDLKKLELELKFSYPKPIVLVKKILSQTKKDAIVLDFFAGSGTTAQAVIELNKNDSGNRKFILCTNNESNICEEITYQRMKRLNSPKEYNLDIEQLSHGLEYLQIKHISDLDLENADDIGNFEYVKHINNVKFNSTRVILENDFTYLTDKYSVFKKKNKNKKKEYIDFFDLSIKNSITNIVFVSSDTIEYDYFRKIISDHISNLPANSIFEKITYYQMSKNYMDNMLSIVSGEDEVDVESHKSVDLESGGEQ